MVTFAAGRGVWEMAAADAKHPHSGSTAQIHQPGTSAAIDVRGRKVGESTLKFVLSKDGETHDVTLIVNVVSQHNPPCAKPRRAAGEPRGAGEPVRGRQPVRVLPPDLRGPQGDPN